MKKVIIILISLLLLSGCGSKNDKGTDIALNDKRFYNIYESLLEYTYKDIRENGYKSFTNTELMEIAGFMLTDEDYKFSSKDETHNYYILPCEKITNHLKSVFGDDVEFNAQRVPKGVYAVNSFDIGDLMQIESYNKEKNYFVVIFGGGYESYEEPYNTSRKIIKATMYNDEIIVKERAVYIEDECSKYCDTFDTDLMTGNVFLFDSPEKGNLIKKYPDVPYYPFNESEEYNNILENAYDYYSEEGYTITHIFKKGKNDKYYFAGSTYK